MNNTECPYCGHEEDVCNEDGFGTDENETYRMECGGCGKTYGLTMTIHYHYETKQVKCFNGGEHEWKRPSYRPPACEYTTKGCHYCETTKVVTNPRYNK